MTTALIAAVGHGSTSLWYLTRATGLVSLVLLSATVVVGIVASVGWTTERWPRFLSQAVHRNLSLFCIALVAVHVVTTVADGYVPISLADAIIPFLTPYRPLWVGFGALAFDMLLAVAITSGVRRRIGVGAWRAVHWLAYLCWPIALIHGLGSGTDARLGVTMLINLVCVGAVAVSAGWRLVSGRIPPLRWRLGWGIAGAASLIAVAVFALSGPLRPGWSLRAGTSQELLNQLSHATQPVSAVVPGTGATTAPATGSSASGSAIPQSPFSTSVQGTYATSAPNSSGQSQVLLRMELGDTSTPLVVRIVGDAVNGGVSMQTSSVTFGSLTGKVTALNGSIIGAVVDGTPGSIDLTMQLNLQQGGGTLTGTVSGRAPQ